MKNEENKPFWENMSLDKIDPAWLFALPIIGGGLWFASSLLFGERKNPNMHSTGGLLGIGVTGGLLYAAYHFLFRTKGAEEIEQSIADLPYAASGHDVSYNRAGQAAYAQAFDVVATGYQARAASPEQADKWLRKQAQEAVGDLKNESVYLGDQTRAARSDATIDVFMEVQRIQQQNTQQAELS